MFTALIPDLSLGNLKIKPVLEARVRYERRDNPDFVRTSADSRSDVASRFRFGGETKLNSGVTLRAVYQYSHNLIWTQRRNSSIESSDLYEAFARGRQGAFTWTVGRQTIRKGDQRLLGISNFAQRPRAFDGIRFSSNDWDFLAAQVGLTSARDDFSKLGMAAYKWDLGESMVIFKRDDRKGDASFWTVDHRWEGQGGAVKPVLEAAIQFGDRRGRRVRAGLLHGRVDATVAKDTEAYVEANWASGGGDATEDRGFDTLYANTHAIYGVMDLFALRNLRHFELGLSHTPMKGFQITGSANLFQLDDSRDGLYSGAGTLLRRPGGTYIDPTGNAGRDVGLEYNLIFDWTQSPLDTLTMEVGWFTPGRFIDTVSGGNSSDSYWFLLSYTRRF